MKNNNNKNNNKNNSVKRKVSMSVKAKPRDKSIDEKDFLALAKATQDLMTALSKLEKVNDRLTKDNIKLAKEKDFLKKQVTIKNNILTNIRKVARS